MKNLRKYIRMLIEKLNNSKEVLGEPDESAKDAREEETEVSAGGVAGVSVPLGRGPKYPDNSKN